MRYLVYAAIVSFLIRISIRSGLGLEEILKTAIASVTDIAFATSFALFAFLVIAIAIATSRQCKKIG